jgi:monofunctional biosynthetic peptidoglycan transglycosylase
MTAKRFALLAAGALALGVVYVLAGLPSRGAVRALARENPGRTSVMRQREREARRAGRAPREQQSWVPLSRVSKHLIHAVIASEDQRFFGHEGVDWDAIQKAAEEDRKSLRFARGGSTITQQLAKNLYFTTGRSLVRKAREAMVARWLEEDLDKKRILELYLNVIEWGDGIYGCQAAAQRYYGKSVSGLDEVEAAGLAAMIPNPRRINPRVNAARHARARRRVLWLMKGAGYLRRDIGGLGAEPPAREEEEEDDQEPASQEPAVESVAPAVPPEAVPATPPGGEDAAPPDSAISPSPVPSLPAEVPEASPPAR